MTKRERAIIMAYTGGVTFTNDDIWYFLEYVKEKTGIELNVIGWSSDGVPTIYFGPDSDKTVEKIRSACKEDFDNLIKSSNEEENKKSERDKNSKLFFEKLKRLEQILERELRVDEVLLLAIFYSLEIVKSDDKKENAVFAGTSSKVSISLRTCINESDHDGSEDGDDAEKVAKKMMVLEQLLGRELNPDKVMLLAIFEAIDIAKVDEKKEEKPKKIQFDMDTTCKMLEIFLGRKLNLEEILMVMLLDLTGGVRVPDPFEHSPSQAAHKMNSIFGEGVADGVKYMDECCCAKKEEKEMNSNGSITGFKELDDALNSIPSDELDKILKAESEKRKRGSNHEFSDAIAEAALDILGIDLKKEDKND